MACCAAKETGVDDLVRMRAGTGHFAINHPLPLQVAAMHGTKEMCHRIWWPDKNSEVSTQVFFCSPFSGRSFVGTIGERRRNRLSSRQGTFSLFQCLSYVACISLGKIEQTHSACLLLLIYYPYLDLANAMVTRLPLFDLARNGQPRMVLAAALR
jgi:hypothetical protein